MIVRTKPVLRAVGLKDAMRLCRTVNDTGYGLTGHVLGRVVLWERYGGVQSGRQNRRAKWRGNGGDIFFWN